MLKAARVLGLLNLYMLYLMTSLLSTSDSSSISFFGIISNFRVGGKSSFNLFTFFSSILILLVFFEAKLGLLLLSFRFMLGGTRLFDLVTGEQEVCLRLHDFLDLRAWSLLKYRYLTYTWFTMRGAEQRLGLAVTGFEYILTNSLSLSTSSCSS